MTTTFGPLASCRLAKIKSLMFSDSLGMTTPSIVRMSRRVAHPMRKRPDTMTRMPIVASTV